MTEQAIAILWDWAHQNSKEQQGEFASYLQKLMAEYYTPKQMTITGKMLERIIENYETENAKI